MPFTTRLVTVGLALAVVCGGSAVAPASAATEKPPVKVKHYGKKPHCSAGQIAKKQKGKRVKPWYCAKRPRPKPTGTTGSGGTVPSGPAPGPSTPASPAPMAPAAPGTAAGPAGSTLETTRDDAAGRSAFGSELRLEQASYSGGGGFTFASYKRLFFFADGSSVYNEVEYNDTSGEQCQRQQKGSWSFQEGYRVRNSQTGATGVLVILNAQLTGQQPYVQRILFEDGTNNAYVQSNGTWVSFERNPNANQNCG